MPDEPRDHPATLAAQALGLVDPTTRSIVPPIYPSATYERAPDGSYPGGHTYTRDQNPTYDQAEALLSRLEGGQGALLFSSGMAAATNHHASAAITPMGRTTLSKSFMLIGQLAKKSLTI